MLARSSGSCFFVASGIAVTNHHVISDAASIDVIDATGTHHVATVLRSSKESDLAVLDVLTAGVAPIGLATSTAPTLGLEVFTIGYPYPGLLGADPKFSAGSISGLAGIGDARYLQITVPIQPGNSGGPLATMDGQVVGVVTAKLNAAKVIEETGSIPENVNFAVKSSELAPLLRGLALPPSRPAKGRAEAIARAQAAVCQVVATQRAPEPSVASGRFDQAKLGGELTREQVAAATRAMSSELAACERTHGPLPIPSVRLVVSVEPSGRVGSVDLPRRYERDPVVRCLGRVFKATAFPAARNASTFRYTYKRQAAPGDTMTPR